jgi:enoyl-CoA hydratase/carnithine racemase
MALQFIATKVADGIGWAEFNRPPVNAFHWEMVRELQPAFDALHADPDVRVIVFASAVQRYFSSGADLNAFATITPVEMREWVGILHALVSRMRRSDKPLLAAINGVAVGGGLEMSLHCDRRFAAADARIGQPEIAIGIIPPVGATQALVRLIGRPAAIRYLYDGQLHTAEAAQALGVIDEVVPPDELRARRRLCGEPRRQAGISAGGDPPHHHRGRRHELRGRAEDRARMGRAPRRDARVPRRRAGLPGQTQTLGPSVDQASIHPISRPTYQNAAPIAAPTAP